jgi:hypothetical protein
MSLTISHIARLPEELLESILALVEATASREDWWNSLRTCRQWHRIGLSFYRGLGFAAQMTIASVKLRTGVEEENPSSCFALNTSLDLETPSELYLSLLRSLTIHVQYQEYTSPSPLESNGDFISLLQTSLGAMRRLTTFSFKFSDEWDYPTLDVPAVPQSLLARLVASLPDSVIDLELDTAGTDVPPSLQLAEANEEQHLCYQISKILPRLRHLRLRTGHVCSALLPQLAITLPCERSSCECCPTHGPAACALLRSWKMRTMTIWLPWGERVKYNHFALAATALLDPEVYNPSTVLMIEQFDVCCPGRTSITDPYFDVYDFFSWKPFSNVSKAIHSRLEYFNFKTVKGRSSTNSGRAWVELTERRRYDLSFEGDRQPPPVGGSTSFPYVAVSTLESMLTWTQRAHGSYRFPISEADSREKMYCDANRKVHVDEKLIWCCRSPGCKERCKSLLNLRGHHMYMHPEGYQLDDPICD